MDPAIVLVVLGIASVIALERRSPPHGRPTDLTELMSGLFNASHDLGWPHGVQEEDTIRPWVATGSISPRDDGPADPAAFIEDSLDPIPVSRVRRVRRSAGSATPPEIRGPGRTP